MKSYLAKLADRATFGNTLSPAVLSARRPPVTEEQWGEILELSSFGHSENRTPLPSMRDESKSIETSTPNQQVAPTYQEQDSPHESAPQISLSMESVASATPSSKSDDFIGEVETVERLTFAEPEIPLMPKEEVWKPKIDRLFVTDEVGDRVERLEEIQRDQAQLLQQADLFMNQLLSRGPAAQPLDNDPEIVESVEELPSSERRLEPPARLRQAESKPSPSQNTESPSLVIGRLTVEVGSPAAKVASSPQVIVVRQKEARSSAALTTRSFGLNQF
jgi:hypothetical protein